MKVLQVVWFSPGNSPLISVVMGEDEITGEKKAYIGTGAGRDVDVDTKFICDHGAKFNLNMFSLLKEDGAKLFTDKERGIAASIVFSMYRKEPCRVCGMLIGDDPDPIYAGYSKCNKSRAVHKECWENKPPKEEWVFPKE